MGENESLTLVSTANATFGLYLAWGCLSDMYDIPCWGLAVHAVLHIPEGFKVCVWS